MKIIQITLLIITCLLFTGCAMVTRQPLAVKDRQQIRSDKLVLNTNQREIKPDIGLVGAEPSIPPASLPPAGSVNPAAAGGGGLIGMLIVSAIDNHRTHSAESQVTPIRTALSDFNFMPILRKQLSQQLNNISWLKLNQSQLDQNLSDTQKKALLQNKQGKTAMFIDANYLMNKNFTALFVSAHVQLSQKQTNDELKTLYNNYFVYVDRLSTDITNRKAALPLWTANHGQRLKSGLEQASKGLAHIIAIDIKNPTPKSYATLNKPIVKFNNQQDVQTDGKVIAKFGSQTILRTSDGSLYSVNANDLVHTN